MTVRDSLVTLLYLQFAKNVTLVTPVTLFSDKRPNLRLIQVTKKLSQIVAGPVHKVCAVCVGGC